MPKRKKTASDRFLKSAAPAIITEPFFRMPLHYVLLFAGACIAMYWSTFTAGFLTYDDGFNIVLSQTILTGDFITAWTHPHYGYYMPITASAWILLAGGGPPINPLPYHLTNFVLHFINSLLVFDLLKMLLTRMAEADEKSAIAGAALAGALLFCVHPLQVEPVCWATGLRDLLSATGAILAIRFYLASTSTGKYFLSLACFVFALLCKPAVAALPLGIFFLNRYIFKARFIDDIKRLALFFIAALPIVIYTKRGEGDWGFTHYIAPLHLRPLILLDTLGFYIEKFFWPFHLAANYSHTSEYVLANSAFYITIPVLIVFSLSVILLARRLTYGIVAGALFSAALLLQVSGLIPFSYQSFSNVADRYMYLPMIGLCCSFSGIILRVHKKVLHVSAIFFLSFLLLLSSYRAPVWENDATFYTAWVKDNPGNDFGYMGLGSAAIDEGRFQDAEAYYRKAISINSLNPLSLSTLAFILLKHNRAPEALDLINTALNNPEFMKKNWPKFGAVSMCFFAAGFAQAIMGDLKNAYLNFCYSMRLFPENIEASKKLTAIKEFLEKQGLSVEPCPEDVPGEPKGFPMK
jgi:protein O-mannosyl-transferase